MSQRTRSRTTGGAVSTPPESAAQDTTTPASIPEASALLAPESLARTLRAVADELERDPELARRVAGRLSPTEISAALVSGAASLKQLPEPADTAPVKPRRSSRSPRARLVPGTDANLGAGIPDPFALYARLGKDGLREALADLRLGTLRAIIREHHLDPAGALSGVNEAGKLRTAILKAASGKKK